MNLDNQVNFVFKCLEKHSADFKIRLRFDGIQQRVFFCSLMDLYLEKDPDMMKVLDKIKKGKVSQRKIIKSSKDVKKGEALMKDLSLTDFEKENIFDMIESDLGEYDE